MTDSESRGYYDFPEEFDAVLIENGLIGEMFYLKDLNQRKMFLNEAISPTSVEDVVRHILQLNAEDIGTDVKERTPILLYITSRGGDVDSGFELIDAIQSSKTPVYTINLGYQYSMAFLIGLAGHKRFTTKNAKFLMHDGEDVVYGTGMKVQDRMDFQKRVEERIRNYVLSNSKITSDEYDSKLRVEWFLFADEAKEKGFTDYIIGEDCELDEVV